MDGDWLATLVDDVERAGHALREAVSESVAAILAARHDRRAGVPVVEIVDRLRANGAREKRVAAAAAIDAYEHAVMRFRAALIRELVDRHGFTLTDVARRLDISRQMVARLYRTWGDDDGLPG